MKYILDTNIISELISKKPNKKVIIFLQNISDDDLYLSVVTIGEIKFGIDNLQDSEKKKKLLNWLYNDLFKRFEGKIVDVDSDIMLKWGYLTSTLKKKGKPMPMMDAMIAATSISKNFTLITRNEKDFSNLDLEIINPFN